MKTIVCILLLSTSVYAQSSELINGIQLRWPANASGYMVLRSDGRQITVSTPALTDLQVQPGKSYTYWVQPEGSFNSWTFSVTVPPVKDVEIHVKPDNRLANFQLSRRKTDQSMNLQCTVNKSTTVEFVK